jgi:DNA-binding response OmpR family regulator
LKHILIVDDDIHINDMLKDILTTEGYRVSLAYSGTEALLVLSHSKPDLILLDLMLPGLSGEDVLQQIADIPVIIISAKVNQADKISLLLNGAVDYITKPFDIEELLARIIVQLRKTNFSTFNTILTYHDILLDTTIHTTSIKEIEVKLTKTEYAILKLLMEHPNQVITKSILLDRISEDTPDCMESSLRVHISNLRKKLRDVSGKNYIEAVWGIGFKMTEE